MSEGFRLIDVNEGDEEELVIHAGGGSAPAASGDLPVHENVPSASGEREGTGVPNTSAAAPLDPAHERLRRRAAELDEAEANLRKTKVPRMQLYVIVGLVLLVAVLVCYSIFAR